MHEGGPFPIGAGVGLAELSGLAHPVLARLRDTEPVSWLPALDGWLVTRRDLALGVMRDTKTFTVDDPRFSTRRVVGPSMLTLDGADHERHRAPFARAFRLGEVRERLGRLVEGGAERLVAAMAPAGGGGADRWVAGRARGGRAGLRGEFGGPLAVGVMGHVLGLGDADRREVRPWYEAIVTAVTAVTSGEAVPDAGRTAFAGLKATVERV